MKAVLVFDNVNDLVFSKWDENFISRMKLLRDQESTDDPKDSYIVSQLLSPIITSQRVMAAQFGNTYTSMKCKDGTKIAFDEWLDHVLLIISEEEVDEQQRELMDLKTLIQHICGQNFHLLHSPTYQEWLSELLSSRAKGDVVPGAGGMIGESGATAAALAALKAVAGKLKSTHHRFHLLLYVGDKLLALYSSRGSDDLTPADVILLSIQCVAAQEYWSRVRDQQDTSEEADGVGITRPVITMRVPWLSEENSAVVNVCAAGGPRAPHTLHVAPVAPRVTLAVLLDLELREIGVALSASIQTLSNLQRVLLQRNLESIPALMDSLENSINKTTAAAARRDRAASPLCSRVSARTLELRRACAACTTAPLAPDACASALHAALEALGTRLRPALPPLDTCELLELLRHRLAPYVDFLCVKAMRHFSLGSYVEEFPGLVHFLMTDRTAGRVLSPDLSDCADMLSREKVVEMLRRGMRFVHEGYSAATWRAGALHACLVLWWEVRGAPAAPTRAPHPAAVRALPHPGDILSTFYRQLTELCFPEESSQVVVKELLCIHLGLLPASIAVQQARRLAHTVRDVAHASSDPADLL